MKILFGNHLDLVALGRTLVGLYTRPKARIRLEHVSWVMSPVSMGVEMDGLRIGLEMSDHSDFWDDELMNWCDVYVKRDMSPRHRHADQNKIIPFGLNYMCHSRRSMFPVIMRLLPTLPRASRDALSEFKRYLLTPRWEEYEYSPEQPAEEKILFQTRVWPLDEAPGDEIINEQRIRLLRRLRKEFPSRVAGGVVSSPLARELCPDLISPLTSRQKEFVKWARKCMVGIYFRGLFDSIGFKMAEYHASSKCIVSEPIENELDAPLSHVTFFKTEDECVAACDRLLSDSADARNQREMSWDYYRRFVRPDAHMASLLARAQFHASREPAA